MSRDETPVSRVHPAGATCDRCGETTTRQWRAEGGWLCADCASW